VRQELLEIDANICDDRLVTQTFNGFTLMLDVTYLAGFVAFG
jgi:hypothetical protein